MKKSQRSLPFGIKYYLVLGVSFLLALGWMKMYKPMPDTPWLTVHLSRELLDVTGAIMIMIYVWLFDRALKVYFKRVLFWIIRLFLFASIGHVFWQAVPVWELRAAVSVSMAITNVIVPLVLAFGMPLYTYVREWLSEIPWIHARLFGQGASARWGTVRTFSKTPARLEEGVIVSKKEGVTSDRIFLGYSTFVDDPFPSHVGIKPNSHFITIANTGAGKAVTQISLTLATYKGSIVVIDPKGEHAQNTFHRRCSKAFLKENNIPIPKSVTKHFEHGEAYVVDPKGLTGLPTVSFNPLDAVDLDDPNVRTVLRAISDASIIREKSTNSTSTHFDDMAQYLLEGAIVYVMATFPPEEHNLGTVSDLFHGINKDGFASTKALEETLDEMRMCKAAGGLAQQVAMTMANMGEKEAGSVYSTLARHLKWASDPMIRPSISHSDFDFKNFDNEIVETPTGKKPKPKTVYLTATPDMARFIRTFIAVSLDQLVKRNPLPKHPTIILCEEFSDLRSGLKSLADGFKILRGKGIGVYIVLQNLSQLQKHYPEHWEEMVGNSNCQFFGLSLNDLTTSEYLSKLLGRRLKYRLKRTERLSGMVGDGEIDDENTVELLTPNEVSKHLRGDDNKQIVIPANGYPMRLGRLAFKPIKFNGKRYRTVGKDGLEGHFSS